jgi:two-component system sensor histidine kinase DesK
MTTRDCDDTAAKSTMQRRFRLLTLAYLLMYPVPWLQARPTASSVAASAAGIALFVPLYFYGYGLPGWRRLWVVAAVFALGFALAPCGGVWSVFVVYAASLAGFSRPAPARITGFCAVLAGTVACGLALRLSPWEWGSGLFFATLIGMGSVFAATMNESNEALARARDDARHLAILAERERIARDLHDVLGHTLTLVAVKADLARKLMERDPSAARREVAEIHAAARAALGEVRAAVTGMRSTTLAAELSDARRALESAGIAVESATPLEPLPPLIETALAYVIREAATNVIRHSGAQRCRITLRRVGGDAALEIQDDGCGGDVTEGNGVTGMRQRLAAFRGALRVSGTAGMLIEARVPLNDVPA